ncbi:panE, apbA [Phaffia rhodozyma]|uniref:2-dehydropantoate 2-reductase n=1 Tax=Phaffia rhodozyma TaxID=264483 RepID=A0A0F7SUF6_PHARH|nr:panE, apbA [Phaffia rhodozyma]
MPDYGSTDLISNSDHHPPFSVMLPVSIIGIGSLGTFFTSQLRLIHPDLPINLLLKSSTALQTFHEPSASRPASSLLVRDLVGSPPIITSSFSATSLHPSSPSSITSAEDAPPIPILLSTLKCTKIVPTLKLLAPRLRSPSSTIVLLHNGMGIYETLIRDVFPDRSSQPSFIIGTTSVGVRLDEPFGVTLSGLGQSTFALVPSENSTPRSTSTQKIGQEHEQDGDLSRMPSSSEQALKYLSSLTTHPNTHPVELTSYPTLLPQLLLKLCMNALINPLTALHSVLNGQLITDPSFLPLLRELISENSKVLTKAHPAYAALFTEEELTRRMWDLCERTKRNRSSMGQDIDRKRETEIEFINGYISMLGRTVDVKTPVNDRLVKEVLELSEHGQSRDDIVLWDSIISRERLCP